ncbi:putative exosome complex component RRP4-like protein [Iris pallida]|uniref:Exosome complex component RRP4-like protein n=1 Tax=Iris pallida TaxID=29817 RepID=A0AAX6F8R7_IRIPA|nr:putative exosome complex component RRP4-like protein [Iris pallida]
MDWLGPCNATIHCAGKRVLDLASISSSSLKAPTPPPPLPPTTPCPNLPLPLFLPLLFLDLLVGSLDQERRQLRRRRLRQQRVDVEGLWQRSDDLGLGGGREFGTPPVKKELLNMVTGHGTSELNGEVVAALCGVVERVNKLVYVRSLRSRYKPEVGDIIVGRVIEIAPKRWRLEINFSQDAVLMLSSMNLPDGIQRRRTAVDELNMRSIFEENDVICAEVRGFQHDGSLQLQARSQKYGKLTRGQMLTLPAYLVKRRKHHFHHLQQYGVDLILGCNGRPVLSVFRDKAVCVSDSQCGPLACRFRVRSLG